MQEYAKNTLFKKYQFLFLLIAISQDEKFKEQVLGGVVRGLYKGYQSMEFYDPYKIEAGCLKAGGDEVMCFKSTFFGTLGYGLFGKQADDGVHIDKKSLDLVARWKKERLEKFQCDDRDCKKMVVKKPE
jgi:hypothetical protein